MSREICHVHIRWLQAGAEAVRNELDEQEHTNRLVYWLLDDLWTQADVRDYTVLCKRRLLNSLYPNYAATASATDWILAHDYSVVNPMVATRVPVTLFELWPSLISPNGWLKDSIDNIGVYDTFKKDIPALENIGLWLKSKGRAVDQCVYGVDFYAAWDFEPWHDSDGDWDVSTTFCGWFDLASATLQHCVIPPEMERRVVVNKC